MLSSPLGNGLRMCQQRGEDRASGWIQPSRTKNTEQLYKKPFIGIDWLCTNKCKMFLSEELWRLFAVTCIQVWILLVVSAFCFQVRTCTCVLSTIGNRLWRFKPHPLSQTRSTVHIGMLLDHTSSHIQITVSPNFIKVGFKLVSNPVYNWSGERWIGLIHKMMTTWDTLKMCFRSCRKFILLTFLFHRTCINFVAFLPCNFQLSILG